VPFPASSPESALRRGEESQKLAVGSAWAPRFLAALLLPQGSVLAALGSLARHAGSTWLLFPASSPESALRRGEESQKLAAGSAWARRFLAALLLPQGSVLAALGSLARHAGSAWVPFPASSPESALRRGEESQKLAVYSVRSATVSVLVSPASLVSHLTASENPQALRKVSLQAGLVERTYFLQPLHLAKHPAHLALLPEHFCLAIVSVLTRPASSVFRPALSENRQASRKVSLQGGLVERTYFLQPLRWVVVSAR
jgi:hypothetical protein